MTSPGRMSSRAHSHLDDLDLQPVREVKERVLNDVPHNPIVPSSRVKFNFVDVSLPRPSKVSDMPESVHGNLEKIVIASKRKRNDHDNEQKENRGMAKESKVFDKENKFSKMAQSHQRSTEDDRHAFLSKLLKRGIPVWEEVPEEERSTKCIGGTNPFRNQPPASNPTTANITLRNSNVNPKSDKMLIPVWEDVQNGSRNSYSLSQGEDLIDSSVDNVKGNEERLQVHEDGIREVSECSQQNNNIQVAQFKLEFMSQHSSYHHQSQAQQTRLQSQVKVQNVDLQNYSREPLSVQPVIPKEQTRQDCNFSPNHHLDQSHIPNRFSSHQGNINLQDSNETRSQEPQSLKDISQAAPIEDMRQEHSKQCSKSDSVFATQERLSRPVMKRKHGGPIEDNQAMECISWWPGAKLLREKNKDGEEEKHEKEPTKEAGCKRDLSALSRSSAKPSRRWHKITDNEVLEKGLKTPPHVKNYEQAEVRKYMRVKRSERHKIRKEQQVQLEQEKIKREERLRELAVRTKQLAQTYKKTARSGLSPAAEKNSDQIQSKTTPSWNCPEGCGHEVHLEKHLTKKSVLDDKAIKTEQKTENYSKGNEDITKLDILETRNHNYHNYIDKVGVTREIATKKRRKKDSKRKNKRKSVSDSDNISDIVSRTVEECERQFKSSSVSLDSLSLSSVSHNSSDSESQSSETLSAVSSLELAPKQRIISLGQMAQRLSSRITEEEENLQQQLLNEKGKLPINPSLSQTLQPIDSRGEISKLTTGTDNIKDSSSDRGASRVPLSYSQIEALSVEELIAKMKSMLPNTSAAQGRSNVADNTNHVSSKSLKKKELLRSTAYDHEENKGERLSQKQDQSSIDRQLEASNKELPKLIPPDIPTLKLSDDDSIRIVTEMGPTYNAVEDLSSLPGYNVGQFIIDERAQKRHPYKLPMQKSKHCFIPSPFHFRKLNQQDQFATPYVPAKEDKMEKAALHIQAAYRGYRVRKITSMLLKKNPSKFLKKNTFHQTKSLQNNTNRTALSRHKFFKNSYFSGMASDLDQEEVPTSEGQNKQIDWQGIKTELESRTFRLSKDSQYIFQRSDLPEWIKPYFVLSETGNVKNFVESKVRELEAQNWNSVNEEKEDILTDHRIERHDKVENSSKIKNFSCMGKTQLDVTLTEGPLSDLEEAQDFSSYEKETQTNFTNDKHFLKKSKNISKEKKSIHNQGFINEEKLEFIDLRKNFTGKKILALQASDMDKECDISQKETISEAITLGTDLNSKAGNASDNLPSQEHGKHEETLEEGLLEETEQSLMQESRNHVIETNSTSHLPGFEEQHTVGSSSIVDSSSISESVKVEEIPAPHKLLGRGPHFGPASLRLRLNAELMYQDSIGEALNQLHNVEQLDILTRSRQEAFALSQSLVFQQQKRELEAQQKIEEEKKKKEEDRKRKKEQEKQVKKEFRKQNEVLWSVEKMEREARDRFTKLEREVRARAEQVLSNASQKNPESSNNQSDVIAAAAVAAVGATISQWERLRPVQRASSADLESQSSVAPNEGLISTSIAHSQHYTSSITGSSSVRSQSKKSRSQKSSSSSNNDAASSKKYLPCSEKLNVLSESNLKSSVSEELFSTDLSAINSSVDEQLNSEIDSDRISLSENILTCKSSNPTVISERSTINQSHITVEEDVSPANMSAEDIKNDQTEEIGSLKFVSEAVSTVRLLGSKERSQAKDVSKSRFESSEEMSECLPVSEDVIGLKNFPDAMNENELESDSIKLSSDTISSEAIPQSKVEEFTPGVSSSSASMNSIKQAYVSHNSSAPSDLKAFQNRQSSNSQNNNTQTLANIDNKCSSKLQKTTKREENKMPDTYSESFEVESGSDGSSTSSVSQIQGKSQRDLTLVVSSGNILNQLSYRTASQVGNGLSGAITDGGSALGMTLNLVESLQKEEEVRLQHQEALLKLQEQSLIEEARWKLAALQSEGGVGLRKRQRAVLLQLREQRAHLKRLIETQNIAAQQRRLMLLQHHHLLATTTNMLGTSSRGYFNNARGRSPSPGSPQLTPRMMEMGVTSSSDAQEDISPHLSVKGRDTGSSSPSDGGGQEKRRSHSEERKKIASIRIQEKRRAAESEALLQQFLHEDREILRMKSKSPHESYEKDFVKSKRKGDYINKRSRDKRNKSPTSVSSQSVLVLTSKTSAESSVPGESINASVHDSQSSVPEGGGSESISHSDLTSSVSEQEGSTYRSCHMMTSVPFEISGSDKSTSTEEISGERQISSLQSSPKAVAGDVEESSSVIMQGMHTNRDSRKIDKSSSISVLSSNEKIVPSFGCQSGIKTSISDKTSKGVEKPITVKSDIVEKMLESVKVPIGVKPSSVGSDTLTQSRSELVPEVIGHLKMRSNTGSSKSGSEFASGSEASSSNTRSEVRLFSQKASSGKALPLPLRVPLSPRSPHRQHRRYSSESDDSFTLSQTETASDISDGEGKLLALKEQLASRRAEAERLKKEKRRLRRERLASQERALRQQISTYDSYIQQAKMELEKESKELQQAVMVKPVIKKPQVAETKKSKLCESVATSPEKSDVSDLSLVSEDSKSGQSCSLKSRMMKSGGSNTSKSNTIELVLESQLSQPGSTFNNELDIISSFKKELKSCNEECPSEKKTSRGDIIPQGEAESLKTSQRLSISEEYSFESETISEHSIETLMKKSLSQDSSFDTDHTPSQASSTETIVHSPQKVDSSQKDGDDTNSAEISSLLPLREIIDQDRDTDGGKSSQVKVPEDSNLLLFHTEDERKLEIFLPAPDTKSYEADEFTEQNTSAEESIGEEIAEGIFEEIAPEEDSLEAVGINTSYRHTSEDSKLEEETDSSNSSRHYTDKEASLKPESPIHTTANFSGYPVKGSHSQHFSADEETSQQHESSSHTNDSLSSFPQHNSHSSCHFADKEVCLKCKSSQYATDNLPIPLKLDCAEQLKNDDRSKNTLSLDRQRLVDDISNNLLSSMMKDTTQLFRNILKDKDCVSRKYQSYINNGKPLALPSEPSQTLEDTEQDDISKTTQLHQEVTESSRLIGGLESLKEDEFKEIKELDDISKSSSLSKSQILKRVGELIGEDGSSCSPSQSSSRPMDFQLTPQMTFDLSPDILSPISPTPASPSRMHEDIEMEQLPETVFVSVSAETDAAIIPGASFPSEISKEDSEDQAMSPSHDISKANDYSLDLMALTNKLLNLATSSDLDLDDKLDQLGADNTEFSVEGIEGDWFDDDFWTSADNRKKQQQLKAEEERIAAEIARLEELQHLQEKYPDLVIREVPNKPPPPYTPPPSSSSSSSSSTSPTRPPAYGSLQNDHVFSKLDHMSSADTASASHRLSKADQRKLAAESFCAVPSCQEEVMHIINDAFTSLYEAWKRGLDPSTVEPHHKHLVSSASISFGKEISKQDEEASTRIFHLLLFCLTRELVSKAYQLQHAPLPPPWVKQPYPPTRMLLIVHTKSKADLFSHVQEQSNVLFGWKPSLEKESLMVRWARKHRDLVDQILVKELHAEESSWTHYDEDEAAVKTQIANEILDTLIAETVTLVMSILARKITHVVQ